ncbi:hypothetical protein J7355_15505 [Endozoicomonas sp. G2_2]|uniref:hypothetical protein n=1 Tax=Endozoicomonas sp. G2_2 TaxID=2821092 RepID=UPI001ADA7EAB|nr:hypothetical protein [Endozoicomonas sp. G2_2]MBO9471495.1 hypothetical protein [Endozoicomonas sp. G2_2]
MKIELKGVKHHTSLSEETNAFTGSVYIDGKRAATASNRGHGEPVALRPIEGKQHLLAKATEFLARQKQVELGKDMSVPLDLDLLIGHMVAVDLVRSDVKRRAKNLCGPDAKMAIKFRDTQEIMVYKVKPHSAVRNAKGPAHEVIVAKEQKDGHDPVCLNTLYESDPEAARRELAIAWEVADLYDWTLESTLATGRL